MLDCFNGTNRMKFSDWEFKMSNLLSAGACEHAGDILEWITQEQEDVADDKVFKVLVHCVEQSHRRDAASTGTKRTTQRRSERLEKAAHGEKSQ